MKELDIYKSSVRLRELRQKQKYSFNTLADEVGVSAQLLKNYEAAALSHGVSTGRDKVNAIAGMSIKTMYRLAKVFGVSADYLLGLSDHETTDKDLNAVCEYTGLSEKAISKLELYQKENKASWIMDVLNAMIENNNFDVLLTLINQFSTQPNRKIEYGLLSTNLYDIEESKAQNTLHDMMRELQQSFENREDYRVAYQFIFSLHEAGKLSDQDYKRIEHEFDNGDFSELGQEENT